MKICFYILFIAFSFINVLLANENSYCYAPVENKEEYDKGLRGIVNMECLTKQNNYNLPFELCVDQQFQAEHILFPPSN